jgi:hypothetical protein
MTEIDDRIRAGLDADDRAFLASLDDGRGLFMQIGDSLGGPLGGWAKLVFALTFALSLAMFYAVWRMFTAGDLRELVLWATATVVLVMSVGFLKDWLFSRMNMFFILREVRRLHVQIALLGGEAPKA